jgi:glycosyltransferase involved in cell wall biosynthesis
MSKNIRYIVSNFPIIKSYILSKILYKIYILKSEPKKEELDNMKGKCKKLRYRPKISIIMPVWNIEEKWLRMAIESTLTQVYDNWELYIADGDSTKPHVEKVLKEYAKKDSRIKVNFLDENKGIAGNSNEALLLATGDFIGFLDHDDKLAPFALYEVVKLLNDKPELDFIYSDEDKIDEKGRRKDPFFKPDWSPDMFLSCSYLCHLSVIRKSLVDKVGGFEEGYDGSQDYDLFLRVLELVDEKNIAHIPKILYHWRTISTSTASSVEAKPYAYISAKKALQYAMRRRSIEIEDVVDGLWTGSYRIKYKIKEEPKVSVIIPTKDKIDVLKRCIDSILKKTTYQDYEIVIVDNNSHERRTFEYYETFKDNLKIKLLYYKKPFNLSAISNYAVSKVDTDCILLLSNEIEVISGEWLKSMLEYAQRKEVGAVGAKLLFSNGKIQHCGIIIGLGFHRVAANPYYQYPDHNGYSGTVNEIRNYSAVTTACMMLRKEVFEEVGGFDESLSIAFRDVDLCMKIREKGYLIVYTPYAKLYHHGSLSRGYEDNPEDQASFLKEVEYVREKWGHVIDKGDPYYNPNLTLQKGDFSIRNSLSH